MDRAFVEVADRRELHAAVGGRVQPARVVRDEADRKEIAVAHGSPFQDGR